MDLKSTIKPAVWGAVGGAIALAVVGFSWGGWVTGGSASEMANKQADEAVLTAVTPICVERFQQQTDAVAKFAALKETETYKQAAFIEEGGWATMTGSDKPNRGAARACADILSKLAK